HRKTPALLQGVRAVAEPARRDLSRAEAVSIGSEPLLEISERDLPEFGLRPAPRCHRPLRCPTRLPNTILIKASRVRLTTGASAPSPASASLSVHGAKASGSRGRSPLGPAASNLL